MYKFLMIGLTVLLSGCMKDMPMKVSQVKKEVEYKNLLVDNSVYNYQIQFEKGKTNLEDIYRLTDTMKYIKSNVAQYENILIVGDSDSQGELTFSRVNSVRQMLKLTGINTKKIKYLVHSQEEIEKDGVLLYFSNRKISI